MALLIHATLQVSGDAALLAAVQQRINRALTLDYPEMVFTEMHGEGALHYDIKTATGIPFPACISASQEFPGLVFSLRWVHPGLGSQRAAEIRAGRIEAQSADPLDRASAGRQPGYVAARADGTLLLAFAIFSVRNDGCTGYAITAERDALFQIQRQGHRVQLRLSEGEAAVWDAGWEGDLDTGVGRVVAPWTPLAIDAAVYEKWREYAQAFVAEWFWLDAAPADETIIDRQRCAEHGIAVLPANLRYEKLKALRDLGASASGVHEFARLSEEEEYVRRVLVAGFAQS